MKQKPYCVNPQRGDDHSMYLQDDLGEATNLEGPTNWEEP